MAHGRFGWLNGIAAMAAFLFSASEALADVKVVSSILPVHSLVAGVMEGAGEPQLLVKGGASPHTYSLKPSEARVLADADIVFWVGQGLETFLKKPLESLSGNAQLVEIMGLEGAELLPLRAGATWDTHDHSHHGGHGGHDVHDGHEKDDHGHDDHGHDDHADAAHDEADHKDAGHADDEHADFDAHLWLDPHNANRIVRAAVRALGKADPSNQDLYQANGDRLIGRIAALDNELEALLAPLKDRPYVVFHDAYQYFEKRFGLSPVGSITVNPDQKPSAKRLYAIRNKILDLKAACVFSEPQFEPALVVTVVEGTDAKTGVLDPLGAGITPGPGAYFELMRNLAGSLNTCLSPVS